MRIAICDDNSSERERLYQTAIAHPISSVISLYPSALELLADYAAGIRHDLVFLEIQTDDIEGNSAAARLCDTYADEKPLVVFTTTAGKYVFKGYGIADGYLCKPVSREDVFRFIDGVQTANAPKTLKIRTAQGNVILRFREIFYIEAANNHLIFCTAHGDYLTRARLEEIQKELPRRMFFRTHRSYIANLSLIHRYDNKFIYFGGDKKAYISRNNKNGFKKALTAFILNGYQM